MIIRDRIKELRRVPARDLIPNPKNWRVHPDSQRAALQGVLDEIGYADAVLAREVSDGKLILIDGHLRAETTPDQDIPVLIVDLTEEEADLLLAVHDPMAAMAYPNLDLYLPLVEHLEPDSQAVSALLEAVANNEARPLYDLSEPKSEGLTDPDDVPEIEETTFTVKVGEVWALGDHWLMCGDAAKAEDIEKLMDGNEADLVLTDPPYGIALESHGLLFKGARPMAGDHSINLAETFANEWQGPIAMFFSPYKPLNVAWRSILVWNKGNHAGRGGDIKTCWMRDFELIGVKENNPLHGQRESGVLHFSMVSPSSKLFAEKPVTLICYLLSKLSEAGGTILDPFLGSGTTLIACEKLGRTCHAMEIEPRYCDVAIKRWEEYTGRKAELLEQQEL